MAVCGLGTDTHTLTTGARRGLFPGKLASEEIVRYAGKSNLVPGSWCPAAGARGHGAEIKPAQLQSPGAAWDTPGWAAAAGSAVGEAALVSAPQLHIAPLSFIVLQR